MRIGTIALLLTALAAAFFASVQVLDSDSWWHLATGQWILSHGLPTTNTFSHTFPDYPWKHAEWLFDVILAVTVRAFGTVGMEVLQAVLAVAAFAITCDTVRRHREGEVPAVYYPLAILAMAVAWHRLTPRPHLVTYVGLALLLNLWTRSSRRMPLWFGVLGAVWANCHSGVVFGAVVVLAMALAPLLQGDRALARRGGMAAATFLVGSFLTPNPGHPYFDAAFHLGVGSVMPISEFGSVNPRTEIAFVIFAILATAAALQRARRRDWLPAVLLLPFLPLAIRHVRILPIFVILTLPGTVAGVEDFASRLRRGGAKAATWALLGLLWLGAAIGTAQERRNMFPPDRFGWGVNWRYLPEEACNFIEEARLTGRMYNDFAQGGFLIWRFGGTRPVFQDGRVPVYPPELFQEIREAYRTADFGWWSGIMDRFGVEYAIVDRMPFGRGLDAGVMFARTGWVLVYLDGVSYVYVRPRSVNRGAEERFALSRLGYRETPQNLFLMGGAFPAEIQAELRRIDPSTLILAEDFGRFAAAALGAGDPDLASRFLNEGLRRYPEDPFLRSLSAPAVRP